MKRIFSLVLALTLSLGLSVPASAADFADVPVGHTFYDAISWCAEKDIIGGYSDGTFRPTDTVTRSNFAVMLSRAFYADEVAMRSTAPNLRAGPFFPNFVTLLFNNALVNTSFSEKSDIMDAAIMNRSINREDMAQLINNIMAENGISASSADKNAAIAKISDYNSIPSQYKDAVANVYALGVIGGYSDGSFGGALTMNRGQAAVVIYRLAQYVGNGSGIVAAVPVGDDLTNVPTTPAAQNPSTNAENGALTLRDGSVVTEANALKIIEQVKQVYPAGYPWGETWRDNDITIGGRRLGSPSGTLSRITNTYVTAAKSLPVSMTGGCGGFAGVVSDAIFGGYDNGSENFPIRKLNSLADIRPGDIIVNLDGNGKVLHVLAAASGITSTRTVSTGVAGNVTVYTLTVYDGNNGDKVHYASANIYAETYYNARYEAWTRYPE